ncbi:XdhC family protein [Chloracidobacterium aggregatum]|uniref:XdhC family protein n=1 Tax=Chloracidobacterium sp. N TaxID=2821540 RepID=A0ABX8B3P2_9BACT|nr:XdhC/CoxI family protein [Chloracidobacterium aggregatum]QUV85899.1 XdhC family protein [Chloracidobacterium sp. 2]QUV89677.1 XdhC family protein [Chloracidobacterium sp. S]QUV92329.1 XdhC family protein [Chloracidobacterium sp. A]QUV95604.1 XdhC family protein [Chloracidobacterium sp. N]QUV98827.1 XdhC family protein [Chloracidobacterium sp. E]
MSELDVLLLALRRFTSRTPCRLALATVVSVTGSFYRRPGARMLIAETGETVGNISGGCLEPDLIERAQAILASGKAQLVSYDLHDVATDTTWGPALGCEGETLIYIEPFHAHQPDHPLDLLALIRTTGEDAALAHIFQAEGRFAGRVGFRLLHTANTPEADGAPVEQADWLRQLHLELRTCLAERRSRQMTYTTAQGSLRAFVEFLPAPLQLTILGAGDDALPLAQLADRLGWYVTVADWRPALATPERFPTARQVLVVPTVNDLPLRAQDHVVVMTHHYPSDKAIVRRLAAVQPRYVGLLGPRRRTERMLAELADEGCPVAPEIVEAWHFPVGLDLGAETPVEVAVSIVAEILAVANRCNGQFLRHRQAPIHTPLPDSSSLLP